MEQLRANGYEVKDDARHTSLGRFAGEKPGSK
jgi:hypothetical protein